MLQKNLPFLRALWVISARMWFDLAALIHFMVKGKFRDAWAVSRAHQRFFLDLFKTARKRTREGHRARLQGWYRGSFIRSEEHTSELQSLMRISYAVFCLKKKKTTKQDDHTAYYQNTT